MTRHPAHTGLAALLLLAPLLSGPRVNAESLQVRVHDAATGAPLSGAFVQVGRAPGLPFAGNGGRVGPDGRIVFADPALTGPQTVTASAIGFARFTVVEAAADSISLELQPELAPAGIIGPKAKISGSVLNIATVSNDGNLDIGFIYPAVGLSQLIGSGAIPIEVPQDTVTFPIIGTTVLPGNVVVPTQTEAFILTFSKPTYRFFVPTPASYDFVVVAGRVPLASLTNPDILNLLAMREIGVERNVAVSGDRTLTIDSDLNLTRNLTVTMPEAPPGADYSAFTLADIVEPSGTKTFFYDSKSGVAGVTPNLLLSGRAPGGDIAAAQNYLFGQYADSSAAAAWGAGRIDRVAPAFPSSRVIGDFFNLPALTQDNAVFRWSDVARPGITPNPTWALARFTLAPITPGDTAVVTRAAWDVLAPAAPLAFELPALPDSVTGGLPNPDDTAAADRLEWDHLLIDPAGSVQQVLDDPYPTVTRFSRRAVPIARPVSGLPDEQGRADNLLALGAPHPNPFARSTRLDYVLPTAGRLSAAVFDAQGRLVRRLLTAERPAGPGTLTWDGRTDAGRSAGRGVYFVRVTINGDDGSSLVRRLVVR